MTQIKIVETTRLDRVCRDGLDGLKALSLNGFRVFVFETKLLVGYDFTDQIVVMAVGDPNIYHLADLSLAVVDKHNTVDIWRLL